MSIDVIQFSRRPASLGWYSIEGIFQTVRRHLPPGISVVHLEVPYFSHGMARRAAICHFVRRNRGRINHITGDITFAALALPRPGLIVTIHDTGWVGYRGALRQALVNLLWIKLPARHAPHVTVVSEFTRRAVLAVARCHPDRVRVVPNCVDPVFDRCDREFRADTPEVLFVGTAANKNLSRLCAALESINCSLHIIGELTAEQLGSLRRHRIAYRNSVNLGRTSLAQAYASADLVAFPSLFEGFGMPIIEAQAVGRPVVASRLTVLAEVAGQGALFVNPLDIASIRAGLREVIKNATLRNELIAAGFENVRRFSPEVVAAAYSEVYREASDDQ